MPAKERVVDGQIVSNIDALDRYETDSLIGLDLIPIKELTYKPTNGFGTYSCELANSGDYPPTFISKGNFVRALDIGQSYHAEGEVVEYRGTKQFKVEKIEKITPVGKRGVISFLKSLEGMRFQAEIIWDTYGEDTIRIIKEHPLDLMSILPSAYPEMLYDWKAQIDNIKDDYSVLNKLMALGIRSEQGKKLYDKYGNTLFEKLNNNPYFLSKELPGYGFKKCDAVARKMGIVANDTNRLAEGIFSILRDIGDAGNTYIAKDELKQSAMEQLSFKLTVPEMRRLVKMIGPDGTVEYDSGDRKYTIDGFLLQNSLTAYLHAYGPAQKEKCKYVIEDVSEDDIEKAFEVLKLEERIVIDDENDVYIKDYFFKESEIAQFLKNIKNNRVPAKIDIGKEIDDYCSKFGLSLEIKQREAVYTAIKSFGDFMIINGAAGCGKTFCIKIILAMLEKIYTRKHGFFSSVILAPTGKASRVAAKATGSEASTIHRALKCLPGGGFFYNANNKLPYHCIVIDESSMVDCNLAYSLFSAIDPETKVIMMGDTNQLASIGAGNVFKDIIESEKFPVITLDVIKRQGLDSGIVLNSHRVIKKEMISSNKEVGDFMIYKGGDDETFVQKTLKNAISLFNVYGINGMQLLSPQRTGILGTNYLNFLLQEQLNNVKSTERIFKQKFEISINSKTCEHELYLKAGDKVINTKNDYTAVGYVRQGKQLVPDDEKMGITNGEMGTIVKIRQSTNEYNELNSVAIVKFEDKYVIYENDFSNLELCYAMTVHKSQGSEWPGVLFVVYPGHKYMLDRNILYTGITRAKDKCILISDAETLKYAINADKISKRNTGLKKKIIAEFS